ncbi:hypothetical protein F0562_034143 [Nyssa sinensis]|uniref:Uncharacterized protein n=1 Tax=Nyssa sinensis TaxID=561372 RepID=A0A5J5AJT6_9ASTE|nr:hypothetical protein F0562_034143 [Nyssa sinensis]
MYQSSLMLLTELKVRRFGKMVTMLRRIGGGGLLKLFVSEGGFGQTVGEEGVRTSCGAGGSLVRRLSGATAVLLAPSSLNGADKLVDRLAGFDAQVGDMAHTASFPNAKGAETFSTSYSQNGLHQSPHATITPTALSGPKTPASPIGPKGPQYSVTSNFSTKLHCIMPAALQAINPCADKLVHGLANVRPVDTQAGATAVSNFEEREVYASTPVAAMHDSPTRLTWADQASSGEFIPKEALDLEEEGGSETSECRTRSKLATGQKTYSPVQLQKSRFPAICKVTVQPTAATVAIQPHMQRADPIGGGALPHSHTVSPLGSRGTGPLVNPPQIMSAIDGQEDNLASVSILVGQTSEGAHPNLCAAHEKAKGHAALPTDHTDCTATITSRFNMLASSSSVGYNVPSQHEGLISPSVGVACPSVKVGCSDTAHPPTPNVALKVQVPSNVDQVQPLQPTPIPKLVSTFEKIS